MSKVYFPEVEKISYEGQESENPLAYRWYNPEQKVLGKTMLEHCRFAVCYWHTFCWHGNDAFGGATRHMPWFNENPMICAKQKLDAAFEFIHKLNVPYFTFHDIDVAPDGDTLKQTTDNFHKIVDLIEAKMHETGIRLLWGTANLFSNKRYMAGAATNPNPEMFACAAVQVRNALEATHRLQGENYVLWGGREGYDSLLNTNLPHELDQYARFLTLVAEHKHKIGFKGTLLIEPKPCEPTKHQYDHDVATVYGFLKRYGLENEFRVNIEANHATLAGHSFEHEVATSIALGIFGSIDANRGDPQNGWDTDQFPNSLEEFSRIVYHIVKSGGFTTGGFNFDAKVRRQSIDTADMFHGHVGAIDMIAKALLIAAEMITHDVLGKHIDQRYGLWKSPLGKSIMEGKVSLEQLANQALAEKLNPEAVSGQQEWCENQLNRYLF